MIDYNDAPDAYLALSDEEKQKVEVRPGSPLDRKIEASEAAAIDRLHKLNIDPVGYGAGRRNGLYYFNEEARRAFASAKDLAREATSPNGKAEQIIGRIVAAFKAARKVNAVDTPPIIETKNLLGRLNAILQSLGDTPTPAEIARHADTLAAVIGDADAHLRVPDTTLGGLREIGPNLFGVGPQAEAHGGSDPQGGKKPIPPSERTRPMQLQEAARFLGLSKGVTPKHAAKKIKERIESGDLRAEPFGREFVFSKNDFPEKSWPNILPDTPGGSV